VPVPFGTVVGAYTSNTIVGASTSSIVVGSSAFSFFDSTHEKVEEFYFLVERAWGSLVQKGDRMFDQESRVPKSYQSPSSPKYRRRATIRLDDLCRRKSTMVFLVEISHYVFGKIFSIADNFEKQLCCWGTGK